jgi:RNA polymerase sigma-70 factor (ECF subfamily)
MAESVSSENRNEYVIHLHRRLLEADPVAPAEAIEAFLDELVHLLRVRAGPIQDETLIVDAATDAFLAYVQDPSKFDPTKSRLLTYLTMSAHGDLLNMLDRQLRRQRRQVSLDDVEHVLPSRNELIDELEERLDRDDAATAESTSEALNRVREELPDLLDQQILGLMLQGERKTSAYASLLGIEDQDPKNQRRTVKRHKDRITKRLQRLGGRIRGERQRY